MTGLSATSCGAGTLACRAQRAPPTPRDALWALEQPPHTNLPPLAPAGIKLTLCP